MLDKEITIQSYKGPYDVDFVDSVPAVVEQLMAMPKACFIIDKNVAEIYQKDLKPVIDSGRCYFFHASEESKSLEQMTKHLVEGLLPINIRRDDILVAIGGGITQDLTCFMAANLFRGMDWLFVPTTLLAQADSCIGSKSSINVSSWKNLMGSFTPPQRILICTQFLNSLEKKDILSGIGEIIKVHIIDGPSSFAKVAQSYKGFAELGSTLKKFIYNSLLIKKKIIEVDEFDKGPRNVMNYGHSFGHAIESATHFAIPHGIAVTIGMDMANFVAANLGRISHDDYLEMHDVLKANSGDYWQYDIPFDAFFAAIGKDKKNVGEQLRLILPNKNLIPEKCDVAKDEKTKALFAGYLQTQRN